VKVVTTVNPDTTANPATAADPRTKSAPATAGTPETAVVPILMYHEIAGRQETASPLAVDPAAFSAQLEYLRAEGFTALTAAGLAAAAAGRIPLPRRPVVITFDDGFADFHAKALPALADCGFAATVFVTTGWVADAGRDSAGTRPGQMLTWSQILEAASAGMEIGAHSHGHPQLDQLAGQRLRNELEVSKALLEDRLGRPVPGLAYPFGYSNARVRRQVGELGYEYACAVSNAIAGPADDSFSLPRLTISRSTGLRAFGRIAAGRDLPLLYLKAHALTKGFALVRHTRSLLKGPSRRAEDTRAGEGRIHDATS
jgi:peptidoglycan/xylan/chitin deacetylase (PgdA/CDA1 family)